jgi:hypothetical protein
MASVNETTLEDRRMWQKEKAQTGRSARRSGTFLTGWWRDAILAYVRLYANNPA